MSTMEAWREGHAEFMEWGGAFVNTLITGEALVAPKVGADEEKLPWPLVVFLELALLQLAINVGLRVLVVQPLARKLMLYNAKRPKSVTSSRVIKFAQSTLETLFYSIYFLMGARLLRSQPWMWPSVQWWTDQPHNRAIADDVRLFYIAYCARYFQAFVMVFLEPKRKDFVEMQIHHSVTCLLIYLSYVNGWVRVGCVIMILLDIADPPLHLAKQFVYLKEVSGKQKGLLTWSNIADAFFALFAVVFTVTRMMMYPYVCWSVVYELYMMRSRETGFLDPITYLIHWGANTYMCIMLVLVLQVLQVFWWILLLRSIRKVLGGHDLKDERSDSEHSDYEDNDAKKDK